MAERVRFRQSRCIVWEAKDIFSAGSLQSNPFTFGDSWWRLLLLKLGTGEKEKIVIYLHNVDPNETLSNKIRSHVFIEDKKGASHSPIRRNEWNSSVCVWWRCTRKLREKEDILLTDGIATFVCLLELESTPDDETQTDTYKETFVDVEAGIDLENLSLDLHHLLDMNVLSDVLLKCGDHLVRAHKSILCARSEVFFDLFRNDTAQTRGKIVEISDVEPLILDQVVKYIYTGKVSDLALDSAQKLYAAAVKYGIDSLKRLCQNFLEENLTEENACDILIFAIAHGVEGIKECALSFILETELLRDDDHWLKFLEKHPKLAPYVLHLAYKAKCLST